MSAARIKKFKKLVADHYRKKGRHSLPWRKTKDPYKILVSEVMLQQTQVSRVLLKYPQFLRAFPTLESLAKAPQKRILSVWQGMGYNRRALALKRLAGKVVRHYGGRIPQSPDELQKLPGIGPYTARAVAIFAWNERHICIETNIRRTYIHHFFPRAKNISDKKLLPIIEATIDKKNPREWYWALMDYGAILAKKVENPNRKSKHYIKQRTFKGSNREARGLILKTLTKTASLSGSELRGYVRHKELENILEELIHEGFLKRRAERYSLK